MSYILDALRRADAERQRGAVPGLHAPAAPATDDAGEGRAAPGRGAGAVVLVAAIVVAAGVLAWRLFFAADDARRAAPAPQAAVQPEAPSPATPRPAGEAVPQRPTAPPAPREPVATQPPVAATPAVPVAPPPRAAGKAAAPPRVAAAPPPTPARRPSAPVPAARASEIRAAAPAAASSPQDPADLPEALRRQLPPLAVGGSMYSENPAQRMLIVNGQVLHEGDRVTPELELEQIRLRSALFRVKGVYRYVLSW